MTAQEFDKKLKNDSIQYKFQIEGSYIIFSKDSDLTYQITDNFTLKELLTNNPVNSYTKLHKTLILRLQKIRDKLESPIIILSTYRDFYYNKRVLGSSKSEHINGNAIDFKVQNLDEAKKTLLDDYENGLLNGGLGLYDTFIHIDVGKKRFWDSQKKKFDDIEDGLLILDSDKNKDIAFIASLIVFLFLFFKIFRK